MEKPVVGQKLFSLKIGNAARRTEQTSLTPVIVKKVGRKYFVCGEENSGDWSDFQYYLDSWQQKTEYTADSILYKTEQEWLDEHEERKLSEQIENTFKVGKNLYNLPLESLRKIVEIIEK